MVLWIAMLGCPRPVTGEYEAAKGDATSKVRDVPNDWAPDAVLHLSHELLDKLITDLLIHYGTLEDKVDAGVATLQPALGVKQVTVGQGTCEDCLGVTSRLEGTLGVDTAVGDTSVPLVVEATFDAKISVDRDGQEWVLALQPRNLRDLDVTLSGMGLGYAKRPLRQWMESSFLTDVPPQEITTLGGEELPLRAVRVVPRAQAVQIHVLTVVPSGEPVPIVAAAPLGWRLDVSPATLTGMAAAEAYAQGPLARDIVPVPTSLSLSGDRFTLGLRLWRVSGRGWWRDYRVTGTVTVDDAKFNFVPEDAKKVKSSPGAAFADPLAALGQGVILKTIEDALETTLPATHREVAEGLRTRVVTRSLTGNPDRITAEGRLVVKPVPEDGAKRKKKRKGKRKAGRRK